jgi:WD40 repeat protein
MIDRHDVLDRVAPLFHAPELSFEGFLRRRDRKRRNQRIAAGVVGIVLAIAVAAGGSALLRSESGPADERRSPLPPILRGGEVLDVRGGRFVALDPGAGDRRSLARIPCKDPNGPCNMVLSSFAMSADGRWLAYELMTCIYVEPCNPKAGLWVMNALDERHQLTQGCDHPLDSCLQEAWAWSPQGAELAVFDGGNVSQLLTIDPQSGDRTTIVRSSIDVSALAWSPGGTSIAYATTGLHAIDLGSGEATELVGLVGDVNSIAWSPDGTQIVLDDALAGRYRILVVGTDGSDPRVLVDQGDQVLPSASPAWSPDGTRIAYVSTQRELGARDHSFEVWVTGADGSDATRLFHAECCSGDPEGGPFWAPDGSRIAFLFFDGESTTWLSVAADGTGSPRPIGEFEARSWRFGG